MKSKELQDMVDEFLNNGGAIEQVPTGVGVNNIKQTVMHRRFLPRSSRREGFGKQQIVLSNKE